MTEDRIQNYKERLRGILSPGRYRHSLASQKVAVKIARHYGLNVARASLAGLFHDCGKGFSMEEARIYIKKCRINLDEIEKQEKELWHGPIGAEVAKREFGIKDIEVLKAIRNHSTAASQMSATAKIIYIADYIEPNRHFKGKEEIFKLAFKDIDLACLFVLNHKLSYILHKKAFIHPRSIEARNDFLKIIHTSKDL